MIHHNVFCPFERIALLVSNCLKDRAEVSRLRFDFGEFGVVPSYPFNQKTDLALGFSVDSRIKMMQYDTFLANVDLLDQNNVIVGSYPLTIRNVLRTDDVPTRSNFNASNSAEKFQYHEARMTMDGIKFNKATKRGLTCNSRPFYNYLIDSVSKVGIVILGPAPSDSVTMLGSVVVDGRELTLLSSTPLVHTEVTELQSAQTTPVVTMKSNDESLCKVLFSYNGFLTPLSVGQLISTIDGVKVHPQSVYFAILVALHYENLINRSRSSGGISDGFIKENTVVLDMIRIGDSLVLTSETLTSIDKYVLNDVLINEVRDRLDFDNNHLFVSDKKGTFVKFAGFKSASCFAASLSYLISLNFNPGITNFFKILLSLVDSDVLVISDGILTGQTASGKTFSMVFNLLEGSYKLSFSRETSKTIRNGVACLYGYDPFIDNVTAGIPDHYVVVYCQDGKLLEIYDPLDPSKGSGLKDVTGTLKESDSQLLYFNGTKVALTDSGVVYG